MKLTEIQRRILYYIQQHEPAALNNVAGSAGDIPVWKIIKALASLEKKGLIVSNVDDNVKYYQTTNKIAIRWESWL